MRQFQYTGQLTFNGEVLKTWISKQYMINVELLRWNLGRWDNCSAPNGCRWRYHETAEDMAINNAAQILPRDHRYPVLSLLWFGYHETHLVLDTSNPF